jgi:hypothetical protein
MAVAMQSGDKVFSSGASSANRLGISTQVPAKASYVADGTSRVKTVAGRTIALKRSRAPILVDASPDANAVLQMLAHIGKANIDADLRVRLADDYAAMAEMFMVVPPSFDEPITAIAALEAKLNG